MSQIYRFLLTQKALFFLASVYWRDLYQARALLDFILISSVFSASDF